MGHGRGDREEVTGKTNDHMPDDRNRQAAIGAMREVRAREKRHGSLSTMVGTARA